MDMSQSLRCLEWYLELGEQYTPSHQVWGDEDAGFTSLACAPVGIKRSFSEI